MKLFTLKPASFPKDRIPEKLEEHNICVNKYAEMFFSHPAFSTEQTREMIIAAASLREIGLENGGTLDEIFRRLELIGARPCPPNTGLFLRLIWKDQPQSRNSVLSGTHRSPDQAVTVLSEIPDRDDAFPKGLYLRHVDGRLWLRGYVCDPSYRFSGSDLFAFEKQIPSCDHTGGLHRYGAFRSGSSEIHKIGHIPGYGFGITVI